MSAITRQALSGLGNMAIPLRLLQQRDSAGPITAPSLGHSRVPAQSMHRARYTPSYGGASREFQPLLLRRRSAPPCRIFAGLAIRPKSLCHHGEVNLVLKARILTADEKLDIVGENVDQRLDPRTFALGEVREHIMLDQVLGARMTDADAHPAVIVADMRGDR